MKIFTIALTFYASVSFGGDLAVVDRLWKARALQAMEKIDKLTVKNGDSRGKNLTKQELCEWGLESSYFAFANPDLSKIVIKNVGDMRYYSIILRGNDDFTQINYSYNTKTGNFVRPAVVALAKGWVIPLEPKLDQIVLLSDTCLFMIPMTDPLNGMVQAG
jgi:hypothetical protein